MYMLPYCDIIIKTSNLQGHKHIIKKTKTFTMFTLDSPFCLQHMHILVL